MRRVSLCRVACGRRRRTRDGGDSDDGRDNAHGENLLPASKRRLPERIAPANRIEHLSLSLCLSLSSSSLCVRVSVVHPCFIRVRSGATDGNKVDFIFEFPITRPLMQTMYDNNIRSFVSIPLERSLRHDGWSLLR